MAILLLALACLVVALVVWRRGISPSVLDRLTRRGGLAVEEIERLRRAEGALGAAPDLDVAARELAKHAMALLAAPAAVVLIEAEGGTVRVAAGDDRTHSPYGTGNRMRLIDDNGVPVGSIAVAARPDEPYGERDERVLDALAARVSSTVHRLSLLEQVRAERQALVDVVASSSDGIVSIGPDLRVRAWNPAMAALTGINEDTAVGGRCCDVFQPVDEHGDPLFGGSCPARRHDPFEAQVRIGEDEDGGERWLGCVWSPMDDGGTVLVARDITARKRLDEEKADFLATVSHELRTPLTPLKGFLQMLAQRGADIDAEERQRVYAVLLREEHRLEHLVDQLLQATAAVAVRPATGPVDWGAVVAAEVEAARRAQPDRPVELAVDADVPFAFADQGLARSVLANLLSNATKFSPPGEPVSVAIHVEGSMVLTAVRDRGPGIPEADRQRVFERFTRLGDHLTRPEQGVGLGLYIARRAVEAMGGAIWIADERKGGATFVFSLPAADVPEPAAVGL